MVGKGWFSMSYLVIAVIIILSLVIGFVIGFFYAEEEMRGNKDFMKQLFEYRNEQESIYKDKK